MTAITCASCGAVVDDAWSVCPACGSDPRIGTPQAAAAAEALGAPVDEAAPQPAFADQAGAPYAPAPLKKARRRTARLRRSAPGEAQIGTTTGPPATEGPGATGRLPIARAALLLIVILFLVALVASGVYAAMRDAWTDVVYVVFAVVIFAVILLGDRRRKRRKAERAAAAAAQSAAGPVPAGQREHAKRTPSLLRTILRLLGTLVVLSLAAVGCWAELSGGEIDEHSHEYNQLSDQVTDLQAETVYLQGKLQRSFTPETLRPLMTRDADGVKLGHPSREELAAILPMLKEARGIVAERNERLASLAVLWDKMLRLDTGEPRNTYCRQSKQIEELDRQMGVVLDQYFAKLEEAGNQAPLTPPDASRIEQEISALLARLDAMQPRYDELVRAAWKYYNEEL